MAVRRRFKEEEKRHPINETSNDEAKRSASRATTVRTNSRSSERKDHLKALDNLCFGYLAQRDGHVHASGPEAVSLANLKSYLQRIRRWHFLRRIVIWLLFFALICTAIWVFANTDLAGALFRIAIIKLLPYWDWTSLHRVPCVVENYSLRDQPISDAHCAVCDDLSEIMERKKGDITAFQVGEDFLVENLPLIVRNAVSVQSLPTIVSVKDIMEQHKTDKTLEPCKFRTNLRTKTAFNFDSFLRKVERPDMQLPWFAFWELCKHHNVREARAVVPRPEELPLMLEIGDSVWFFTARNYSAITFKQIELSTPVFWLTQIYGHSRFKLVPRGVCGSVCRELEATLDPGDLLLVTNDLFDVGWIPGMDSEVLAIGAGAK